ncbi:MAG TPA: glycosyltransferase family 4 protein [Kineosporiaceae bacterium]|nr:glycosyltransferase family 4 protein [Kineosporiaceae bacterium]
MRILHVTDAYLPKSGGIEVQVGDLTRRQLAAGHDVSVLTSAPDAAGRRPRAGRGLPEPVADDAGVTELRVGLPWQALPAAIRQVHAILRRERPDVVHVHLSVWSPLSILAIKAAVRQGLPVAVTLHSLWWYATPLYGGGHVLLRWGRWPVAWTAVSELAARPLHTFVGPDGEISVLPNGIEPYDWTVDPLPRDDREVVVVSVLRLAARKRPVPLLRIVRRARRMLPDGVRLKVVLVGEGPLRSRLERLVRRFGLQDCVELAGRMDRAGIRELYRRADVYVAPATMESFGIAALEARCSGVPVLARRRTGIADFVEDGVHGRLARNDRELARALAEVAASPQLRGRMTDHNRAHVPETGWDDVLQRCDLAYKVAAELAPPVRQ